MPIIHVLGLGPSIVNYVPDGNITIGVNDIYKHHKADYIVLVDKPHRFPVERAKTIIHSFPKKFYVYSHLVGLWEALINNVQPIYLSEYGAGDLKQLDTDFTCYSVNSGYVAAVMAYKLEATEIRLHGVDFVDHHELKDGMRETCIRHFKQLFHALNKKGVKMSVSSPVSSLSEIMPICN